MTLNPIYQYLINHEHLTVEELRQVLADRRERELNPLQCAARLGLLSEPDVKRVRQLQVEQNLSFGNAVRSLSLLDDRALQEVSMAQQGEVPSFGATLERLGLMDAATYGEVMQGYIQEQVRYAEGAMSLPAEVPRRDAMLRILQVSSDMLDRYWGMEVTVVGVKVLRSELDLLDYAARVQMRGDLETQYLLGTVDGCPQGAALELLGDSDPSASDCADVVRELCNVIAGHSLAALASQGIDIELSPPESVTSPVTLDGEHAVRVELIGAFGPFRIALTYAAQS